MLILIVFINIKQFSFFYECALFLSYQGQLVLKIGEKCVLYNLYDVFPIPRDVKPGFTLSVMDRIESSELEEKEEEKSVLQ